MKLDIGRRKLPARKSLPVLSEPRAAYVPPSFDAHEQPISPQLEDRMRRPMIVGGIVIAVLVVGLGLWASLMPLASGITAAGDIKVEANRKTIRHRDPGTIRRILVREGQAVTANQPMIIYDDVEARATYDVLQNQYDTLATQAARLNAEATMRPSITFPAELTARMSDPNLAAMVRDQEFLFSTRQQLFESQTSVLNQRVNQIEEQIAGARAQLASVEEQRRLTEDEMAGYQTLYEKGYAPRNLILRYQRSVADLAGRKGSLLAEVARLSQQMGETRMQLNSLREDRQSKAAEQLRETQSRQTDIGSRLTAARQSLDATVVRSPVAGYVFNLTQFTVGGVTGAGEVLMDVVPSNTPLIVSAQIRPDDIGEVQVGMDAKVRLSGLSARWHSPIPAKVIVVSADKIVNERTQMAAYRVDLRIDPKDLKAVGVKDLTPGMPVSVMIVTGKRSIMAFLIAPIFDTFNDAFRER